MMMNGSIFQASDLATNRVEVLAAARSGRARVRDKDGTSLVMLPEYELEVLEQFAYWSQCHARLVELTSRGRSATLFELGDLAWLRVFDNEDLKEFADELHGSLIAGLADRDLTNVEETVEAWRVTARQLEDPLRRSVLLGIHATDDYDEVMGPSKEGDG